MDFGLVVTTLFDRLERANIRYAAIGGFALGLLGVPRGDPGIDLLVHRDDLPELDRVMAQLGYAPPMRTEHVSHYRHAQGQWGHVDVLHAFRTYSLAMLDRAQTALTSGGRSIRSLQPEDVIGLKFQAVANNPQRRTQDLADIEAVMGKYGRRLAWDRIQEYCDLFELGAEGRRLRERFDHVE
jgi:hypothetical protein